MDEHRELRVFLHLAQTLSFGRTSQDCHVSPATLTRLVQRLEARLGHRLFDRGPRGVALTAEGRRFREYAVAALDLWHAYRQGEVDPGELSGRLGLFATVTACQAVLPDLLAPFRAAHPRIRVDLRTGDAAAALARLDEGEVDAAVAAIPGRLPASLVSRTVAVTDLVFVAGTGGAGPGAAALEGPFVLPRRGLVREAADRWLRGRLPWRPEVVSEPEGHEALLALVALGYGTGIVPRMVLETSVMRDRVRVMAADPAPAPLEVGLCVRRADLRRPLVAALWSLADQSVAGGTRREWVRRSRGALIRMRFRRRSCRVDGVMSNFVPGIELSRAFYGEVVAPLVSGVAHSAALIGPGSEVLEFDTARSADHDWGPRVLLFVAAERVAEVEAKVVAGLPDRFGGFPTVFAYHERVRPGVTVVDLGGWLVDRLGFDPRQGVSLLDWLSAPWQRLAEVTGGEVFSDGLGERGLEAARAALRWYPPDVWRYVLACQWQRICQEEPFVGRCGEVGDELGSAVLGARLAREVMRLALLLRRRYPPYAKWLGSALARLPGSAELGESLGAAVAARSWREREAGLSAAYGRVAALQNRMALAERLDEGVRGFFDRPFQVIGAGRFVQALMASVSDPVIRGLPVTGCVDQLSDSTDLLVAPGRARAVTAAMLGLTA